MFRNYATMTLKALRTPSQPQQPSSSAIDAHVGARIRQRRNELGISLWTLSRTLGVSMQQVQKYELGVNRVSASRLYDIGQALHAPILYFFDGLEGAPSSGDTPILIPGSANGALASEMSEIAALFSKIDKPEVRKALLAVIRRMALLTASEG